MAGYLDTLVGGPGNTGGAAQATWQNGQFMPYNLSLPGANLNFNNGAATGALSGQLGQLNTQAGNQASQNLSSGALNYNPNTSFLPQQYQQIYGNMQGNVNSQFNSLQAAAQPQIDRYLQSNQDNEFSKGTLASTAGQYQTAGADEAVNQLTNQNYAQAFNNANTAASNQFNAAGQTAQQGEQQAEFGPTNALNQTNSFLNSQLQNNQFLSQLAGIGGNLGGVQSAANVSASQNNFQAAQGQDSNTAGFLNNLLFGGGSSGGAGGLLGQLIGGLFSPSGAGGQAAGGVGGQIGSAMTGNTTGATGIGTALNQLMNGTGENALSSGATGNQAGLAATQPAPLTNGQMGLTPDGGVPDGTQTGSNSANSDLLGSNTDLIAGAGDLGVSGIMAGLGSSVAPVGSVAITDAAGNILAGTGAAEGIGTGVAATGAGTGAGAGGAGAASAATGFSGVGAGVAAAGGLIAGGVLGGFAYAISNMMQPTPLGNKIFNAWAPTVGGVKQIYVDASTGKPASYDQELAADNYNARGKGSADAVKGLVPAYKTGNGQIIPQQQFYQAVASTWNPNIDPSQLNTTLNSILGKQDTDWSGYQYNIDHGMARLPSEVLPPLGS